MKHKEIRCDILLYFIRAVRFCFDNFAKKFEMFFFLKFHTEYEKTFISFI